MALDFEAVTLVLVHPTAVMILRLCEKQARSPKQVATAIDEPIGVVAYHFRQLADKGLLELVATKPRRGALEHFYRVASSVRKGRRTHGVVQAA